MTDSLSTLVTHTNSGDGEIDIDSRVQPRVLEYGVVDSFCYYARFFA